MIRITPVLLAALSIAACQNMESELASYHHTVAHPFEVSERAESLSLDGVSENEVISEVRKFALARPNNGSSFVVIAGENMGLLIRKEILSTGVESPDLLLLPAALGTEILRIDRLASVQDCYGPLERTFPLGRLDDGFGYNNTNGTVFGCSVRRNIATMVDDPRTFVAPADLAGRSGARAAEVYKNWLEGLPTESRANLPNVQTTPIGGSGQ